MSGLLTGHTDAADRSNCGQGSFIQIKTEIEGREKAEAASRKSMLEFIHFWAVFGLAVLGIFFVLCLRNRE